MTRTKTTLLLQSSFLCRIMEIPPSYISSYSAYLHWIFHIFFLIAQENSVITPSWGKWMFHFSSSFQFSRSIRKLLIFKLYIILPYAFILLYYISLIFNLTFVLHVHPFSCNRDSLINLLILVYSLILLLTPLHNFSSSTTTNFHFVLTFSVYLPVGSEKGCILLASYSRLHLGYGKRL